MIPKAFGTRVPATENRMQNADSFRLFPKVFGIICVLLLVCSCGNKGNPTLKSYEKPEPPSLLRAIHRESGIILFWDFPKDKEQAVKGFYLLKSSSPTLPPPEAEKKGGGGDFERMAFLENDKRSYIDNVDNDFKPGCKYKYKIVSLNLRGVISNDSNILDVVPETVPLPPGNILFNIGPDSLILNWESAGAGILYNIYKSNKKGIYQLMPLNKEPIKETSFRDNLDIKNPVYYTIRSLAGGAIRDEGTASEEIEINPLEFVPTSPSGLQAVATPENVYLIWKESPETWVAGYRVYREINEEEGFIFIGETQTPTFLDKDKPSTKRNYRVTAVGPSKEGPPAEIKDVVFVPFR